MNRAMTAATKIANVIVPANEKKSAGDIYQATSPSTSTIIKAYNCKHIRSREVPGEGFEPSTSGGTRPPPDYEYRLRWRLAL